ncbi:hypothetical protein [Hymenopteran arli-related virus OKIAV98]|uniref:Uncharacterized protein n=1 Tax=Hymenopteran arli-related virus OKIAV98 TaxID=2792565 RepID=A0AAE7PBJ8_9MONO|nr:hypothetical protein QKS99_gp2 [Hymenopteran arli-related virus OKIAV98]QPL15292.1 hypothetical protein [Hymenopteran arli-related virus OKIAV98]
MTNHKKHNASKQKPCTSKGRSGDEAAGGVDPAEESYDTVQADNSNTVLTDQALATYAQVDDAVRGQTITTPEEGAKLNTRLALTLDPLFKTQGTPIFNDDTAAEVQDVLDREGDILLNFDPAEIAIGCGDEDNLYHPEDSASFHNETYVPQSLALMNKNLEIILGQVLKVDKIDQVTAKINESLMILGELTATNTTVLKRMEALERSNQELRNSVLKMGDLLKSLNLKGSQPIDLPSSKSCCVDKCPPTLPEEGTLKDKVIAAMSNQILNDIKLDHSYDAIIRSICYAQNEGELTKLLTPYLGGARMTSADLDTFLKADYTSKLDVNAMLSYLERKFARAAKITSTAIKTSCDEACPALTSQRRLGAIPKRGGYWDKMAPVE